ncbi:MAG TPA: hypothetical protein VGA13_11790 [Acidimicrobiales bacterium]
MNKFATSSPTAIAVGLVGLGFVALFFAWNGAAGRDFIQGQFPYLLSGGLVGIGLIASGLTSIVVQNHRRDTQELIAKLDEIADRLSDTSTQTTEDLSPRALRALERTEAV